MPFAYPPLQHSRVAKERHEQKLQEFEMRRKIQATVVPTDVEQVRRMLRQLGEPVTMFGEREVGHKTIWPVPACYQ